MKTKRSYSPLKIVIAVVVAALLTAIGIAFAAPAQQDHFRQLGAVPSLTHSAVSSVDTRTAGSAPISGHYKETNGNPYVVADVETTDDGATATLALYLWHYDNTTWTLLTVNEASQVTCNKYTADDTYRPSAPVVWKVGDGGSLSATHYEIRLVQWSLDGSATADISVRPWSFGAAPE